MIGRLFNRRSGRRVVDRLHGDIVTAARRTEFYVDCGVPDTFEGRFEMLVLLMSAVVRRLNALPGPQRGMAQDLTDSMFRHLDIALREIGVSDLGVPKRMKMLASAYFGRAKAYEEALAQEGGASLAEALARNIYSGATSLDDRRVQLLAGFARDLEAALAQVADASLLAGRVPFPVIAKCERDKP